MTNNRKPLEHNLPMNFFNPNTDSTNPNNYLPIFNPSLLNSTKSSTRLELSHQTSNTNCSYCPNLFDRFYNVNSNNNHHNNNNGCSNNDTKANTNHSLLPLTRATVIRQLPGHKTNSPYSRANEHQSDLGSFNSNKLHDNATDDSFAHVPPVGPFHPTRIEHHAEEPKPNFSYIGLIAKAILSTADRRMILSEIYQWIQINYPYFRTRGPGWRNSIRHNLSLNDCFIKVGRAANGKGHYWGIHPANLKDFLHGDFRRRRAQRKVRQALGLSCPTDDRDTPSPCSTPEHSSLLFLPQLNSWPHLKPHLAPKPNSIHTGKTKPETIYCPQEFWPLRNWPGHATSCSLGPLAQRLPSTETSLFHVPASLQSGPICPTKDGDPLLRLIYTNLLHVLNQFPVVHPKWTEFPSPLKQTHPCDPDLTSSLASSSADKCSFSVVNLLDDASPKRTNPSPGQFSLVNPSESEIGSFSADSLEHLTFADEDKAADYLNPLDYTLTKTDLGRK